MKISVFAALALSACLAPAAMGQVKSTAAANNVADKPASDQTSPSTTRARVLRPDPKSDSRIATLNAVSPNQTRSDFNHSESSRGRRSDAGSQPSSDARGIKLTNRLSAGHTAVKPASGATTPVSIMNTLTAVAPGKPGPVASTSTQTYRVGIGDVLDIQLAGNSTRNSTLFTVLDNGVLEYPLVGNPLLVSGMTTAEVAAMLRQRIKIFDNPNVTVSVRDYASHSLTISGLVAAPGTKVLRREAVPLYTILAEALVLPEAGRATISRQGRTPIIVDLKDTDLAGTLVLPGDVIKVSGMPPTPSEFYFAGGEINSPGQKPFHAGLTLTQAVLACGGAKATAGVKVKISRQGTDGRLNITDFNLRKIQSGKEPDPLVQKGDRIELTTAN